MFLIYDLFGFIFLILSPLLFVFRILMGKEDVNRLNEKFCLYSKRNNKLETIWFHGASVGEIKSILPVIIELEKNKKVKKILLTSSTSSSALIFKKYKFKKTSHVYFPLDIDFITKLFIKYWKPKLAIFIDSEIWPNMIFNLDKKQIPIILINGRITKKSYLRWKRFPYFSRNIFSKISLALPQNKETQMYLKNLGLKNIRTPGNLKYIEEINKKKKIKLNINVKNRKIFCAASTHYNEETLIGNLHKQIKIKLPNFLTIIIPRHINRSKSIQNDLENMGLKVISRSSNEKIINTTDIYIVDTYGEASQFYSLSNLTFLGGSFIQHGGQNPIEPARSKNHILHGPYINNFTEVYDYLNKLSFSTKVKNINEMKKIILKRISYRQSKKLINRLEFKGKSILKDNLKELLKYIK